MDLLDSGLDGEGVVAKRVPSCFLLTLHESDIQPVAGYFLMAWASKPINDLQWRADHTAFT